MNSENNNSLESREKLTLPPCLIVLYGVPLSGKTHLSEKLVNFSNLQSIDVDAIRNEIDDTRKQDSTIRMLEPDKELEVMTQSYVELCKRVESAINSGAAVIMTGTFSRAQFKQPLEQLIQKLNAEGFSVKIFHLTIPDEEALDRIERRKQQGSLSNIDSVERYNWAKSNFSKIEFAPVVEIDTSDPNHLQQVIQELRDLK